MSSASSVMERIRDRTIEPLILSDPMWLCTHAGSRNGWGTLRSAGTREGALLGDRNKGATARPVEEVEIVSRKEMPDGTIMAAWQEKPGLGPPNTWDADGVDHTAAYLADRDRNLPLPAAPEPERKGFWTQTYTGEQFWHADPRAEEIHIADVAHALSLQCRFSGHTRCFYSVAQHSIMVSHVCDPADALWGLLHDAPEAYVLDLPRPLKYLPELAGYLEIEHRIMALVCKKFGLAPGPMPPSVKRADEVALYTEKRDLLRNGPDWGMDATSSLTPPLPDRIHPLPPVEAEYRFLQRFAELTGQALRLTIVPKENA